MVLLVTEVDEVDERFDDDRPPSASRRRDAGRRRRRGLILFVLIAGPLAQVLALVLSRSGRQSEQRW